MLLNFGQIPETVIPNMRGGEGQVAAHMFTDSCNKIMKGLLAPGCTIGLHTHDTPECGRRAARPIYSGQCG